MVPFRVMNHRERFLAVRDFLKPYQRIWQNEIMLTYPGPLADYPEPWLADLLRFEYKADVIRLEKKDVAGLVADPELAAFYRRIEELSALPRAPAYPPMPEDPWTWLHMIPKKQHEIRRLAPHVNHLHRSLGIADVIDIGGGIGLFAQTLNNQYRLPVISVDMNAEFQRTGRARHELNARDPENKVRYKNLKVEDGGEFRELLGANVLPVGLHTCGPLAVDIIRAGAGARVPGLVNFGCCYQTLDDRPGLQNISAFARGSNPLWLNQFALTLSCRAHRKMNEKTYDFKLKVKLYRYGIHILLADCYGLPDVLTLGNTHHSLYDRPFSEYALEQLRRLPVTVAQSPEELDAFFAQDSVQVTIRRMLAAGLVRNALGRVLELYLMLDRAIFLEEAGYDVSVAEFFDESASPRNIGITAIRRR
jgi:hypothetical protein